MKSILIIEDDLRIRETLEKLLVKAGYSVRSAGSIADARAARRECAYDLITVDLGLPDGLPLDLCREIKAEEPALPIIVITSSSDEESAVRSLTLGASDFVRKPFFPRELLVRVKKLIDSRAGHLRIGKLMLNLEQRRAFYGPSEIQLTPSEFMILYSLMEKSESAVNRKSLLERLDPGGEIFDSALNTHVSRLREKLAKMGVNEIKIVSLYGTGYRLQKVG